MTFFNKKLFSFLFFFTSIFASTYVSTVTGTRVVTGYLNASNAITVIVTLTGNDRNGESADKSAQYIELFVGFGASANVSTIATQMSGLGSNPVPAAVTGSDNTHTFTVSYAALLEAYGQSIEGKYFDFKVRFSGDTSTYLDVTPSDGGSSHKIDTSAPSLSNQSYPGASRFNAQKVIYQPTETLFQTTSTYQSYFRFIGNTSGSGADNGNAHIYNFSGTDLATGSNITKDNITFSSGGDLVDGAGYNLQFYLYDVAGNYRTGTWRSNIVYDLTAPRIASATSGKSNGTYKKGETIDVTLTFSEAVYTNGVMNVVFTMDGSDYTKQVAAFGSSGSPVTTKQFDYVVQDGNVTSDLTIGSIAMASGNIIDQAGNNLSNYNFTGNNLGQNKDLNIDGQPPTITAITSDKSDGTYGIGTDMNITATFSENVTLAGGNFVMTLETGSTDRSVTVSSISNTNTSSGTYTVQSGDVSSDLNATTNASTTGTISDAAGNAMESFAYASNFNSKSIVVETTAPTISNVTSSTNNGTYGIGQDVNITVTFSENVTMSGSGGVFKVPLETGSTNADYELSISSISNSSTGSGTYTVRENDDTAGSDLEVKASPGLSTTGTVKDHPAGNTLSDFAIPDGQNLDDLKNIKIDGSYPTITNVTSTKSDGTYGIGEVIPINVTFSEDVTLANGTLDLVLNHGNNSNSKISVATFSGSSSASQNYTVAAGDTTNDLNHSSISLSASNTTLKDGGNNAIQSFAPTSATLGTNKALKIDGNRPTIMKIRSTKSAGYYKVGEDIPIEIYFSEAVTTTSANILSAVIETGSTNSDATLTYGAISNATVATATYQVRANDYNPSLSINSIAISGGQNVNDQNGNAMTSTAIPSGKNLDDEIVNIFVDGVLPVDPGSAITMATTGGNIVSGKYNDTNTGVDFTVPLQTSDASLVGGTIQMKAKIAPNDWVSIGSAHTITDANKSAGSATISIASRPIENDITGFADDADIKIKCTVTDVAGNSADWAQSSNSLVVDIARPTINTVTSTTNAGLYNINDQVNISLGFSENVSLSGGSLLITLNSGGTVTIAESDLSNANSASGTYTVLEGHATADKTPAKLTVSSVALTAGELKDNNGNPMNDFRIASNLADVKTIEIDGIYTQKKTIQSVTTVTDTIRAGWWNSFNTAIRVAIEMDKNDASLAGGTIQITAEKNGSGNGFENIGNATTIIQDDVSAGLQTVQIDATISGGVKGFEEITGFQNGAVINFKAIVTDKAGNQTSYDVASTSLTIDQDPPATFTTGTVYTVGGEICWDDPNEISAGDCYWNEDNTSISIEVPIANDASLVNGTVQIQASANGSFEFIGSGSLNSASTSIGLSDKNTTKSISVNGASTDALIKELEELTGFANSATIDFRAVIVDAAGNSRIGSNSSTQIVVDQVDPSPPTIVLKSSSDSGIADWDNLTNDLTPTFTLASLTNNDSVFVKVGLSMDDLALSSSIDKREKTTSTSKDITISSQLNGLFKITAMAKDPAGNWSTNSTSPTFVRTDNIAPNIPNAPDIIVEDDSGFENNDDITKIQKPRFEITGISTTRDSLRLIIDGGSSVGKSEVMSQIDVNQKKDTLQPPSNLTDGYHTAGVVAIDSAGNASNISVLTPFVIDATAPPVPNVPDMTAATDLGESNTDNRTSNQKPTFDIGNLEEGAAILLYGFFPFPVVPETDTTLFVFDTLKAPNSTSLSLTPTNDMNALTNNVTKLGEWRLFATSEDTAGNISKSNDLQNVIIDATPPEITTHYYNSTIQTVYNGFTNKFKADSVRFGKGGDELELIAKLSEPASTNPEPTLSVTYGANSPDSFTAKAKTSKSNNDSTFTWKFDLPSNARNDGAAVVSFVAYDRAGNLATVFTDTQKFIVDNTPPAAFTTGIATAGSIPGSTVDTTVFKLNDDGIKYWYLNKGADSVNVTLDLPTNDASLLGGGYVDIQARVRNRMLTEWLSVDTKDTSNPFAKQDSIKGLGAGKIFTRNKNKIIDPLTPKGLIQGDTIDLRARVFDRSLNVTNGALSATYFVLDTLPPLHNNTPTISIAQTTDTTLKNVKGSSVFLTFKKDTLFSSDTLSFAFRAMYDPANTNEKKSDLQRYEYKIEETPTNAKANWAVFRDWRSAASKVTINSDSIPMLLDSVFLDTFALTHNRNYRAKIRGIDQAGNISDDFTTSTLLRYNDKPIIDPIADAIAKEDILWEKIITITDKDVATLRTDSFTFSLESYFLRDTNATKTNGFYTFKNPKIDSLNAKITSNTGYFSFTPDKWDTTNVKSRGGYIHRIFANDLWGFKDTIDLKMVVEAVNDPPIIDLSSLDMLKFLEGVESDTINLSRFVTDEDDSTHTLTYSANIRTSLKPIDGYPVFGPSQKLIFLTPVSKEAKKSYINQLIDENPSSTIIQEDNAFLVYEKGVKDFADPLTVKTAIVDDYAKFSSDNTASKIDDSTYTWIKPIDLDYFNKDTMLVEFTVKDSSLATGVSTIAFAINPLNDVPVWSSDWFKDTVITENDSLYIDFGKYLKDVDDDSLKISIIPTTYKSNIMIDTTLINANNDSGYVYISGGLNDTIKFKPQELWFETDGIYQNKSINSLWNPLDQKSNKIEFKITAADDSTTDGIDTTFTITVQRVPRPEISMYVVQNNAFTNFYEIFIVDSLEKTKEVTLEFGENNPMPLDTAAAYMWYSHIYFRNAGSYFLDVKAKGAVGDTVVNVPLGVVMSFASRTWEGKSADGVFKVRGNPGAVDFDQSIMIVDSTLFEPYFNDRASYLMGNESLRLTKSVEVSMAGDREELAIYRRSTGAGWEELPSITRNGRIVAFTDRMGYFRKGPKTIIVPGQTSLNQNYPNPFNPSTTIEYDLGFGDGPSQRVNLNIYDILGRTVKTLLFNEDQTIGRYQIRWDGKDENNIPVSSGVYFVYLQTDKGRTYTKKIMLMR